MKLWYSFTKELKLASSGFYFWIELIMAALIIFILLFIIPENFSSVEDEYLRLDMPDVVKEYYLDTIIEEDLDGQVEKAELKLGKEEVEVDLYTSEYRNMYIIEDLDDLVELAKADRPLAAADIVFDEDTNAIRYEYYIQGYESDRLQNLYKILHSKDLELIFDKVELLEVRSLEEASEPLNSREMAVPSLLTFNGSLMGMFIIAAYIFLDKQEGIIKAYAVTASKVWQYLMSKVMVMTTVTIVTTFAISLAVMGFQPNYFMMLVLLLTSSFFGSSLGLVVSSFYDSMTKAFAAIYTVMMLMMMPAIAYFIPSWEPLWIKFIPTHYIIQGFKEIVLENGDMMFVLYSSIAFLFTGIVLFLLANMRFKKTLVS